MIDEPSSSHYLDALRNDLPTASDEARIRRHLTAIGLGVTVTAVTHASTAAVSSLGKVSLLSSWSLRFADLPLLSQLGLVTAATAVLATGPAVVIMNGAPSKETSLATLSAPAPRTKTFDTTAPHPRSHLTPTEMASTASMKPRLSMEPLTETAPQSPSLRSRPSRAQLDEKNSTLAEETGLVDSALSAIRATRFDDAARLLRTHEERFPHGTLELERERAVQKLREAQLRLSY